MILSLDDHYANASLLRAPLRPEVGLAGEAIGLVAYYEGIPFALMVEGGHVVLEILDVEENGSTSHVDDFLPYADGFFIVSFTIVDDGPGDWPGSREVAVSVDRWRPATGDEWLAFCSGDYPWVEPWHVALAKLRASLDPARIPA